MSISDTNTSEVSNNANVKLNTSKIRFIEVMLTRGFKHSLISECTCVSEEEIKTVESSINNTKLHLNKI